MCALIVLQVQRSGTQLLAKMALAMVPALFVRGERPPAGRMYVVVHGHAFMHATRTHLRPGTSWGMYPLLVNSRTDQRGPVKAVTDVQVASISLA